MSAWWRPALERETKESPAQEPRAQETQGPPESKERQAPHACVVPHTRLLENASIAAMEPREKRNDDDDDDNDDDDNVFR